MISQYTYIVNNILTVIGTEIILLLIEELRSTLISLSCDTVTVN